MKNNGILMLVLVFMLPLSAAESQKNNKTIFTGETLCELVIHNGMIAPDELIRFPCISKHVNFEASKKLDEHRLALKNYIKKKHPTKYCEVAYSKNRLEAAVIEYTDLKDDAKRGKTNLFRYVYFGNTEKIKSKHVDYIQPERHTEFPPFFTKDYVCLDFYSTKKVKTRPSKGLLSIKNKPCSKILTWERSTKKFQTYELQIICDKVSINAYCITKTLPNLYKKLIQNVYTCTQIVNTAFVINLAQTGILTEKDVHTLSKFIPKCEYHEWLDIRKKHAYYLLNVLACYGSRRDLLNEINEQVGKHEIEWKGLGKTQVYNCIDHLSLITDARYPVFPFFIDARHLEFPFFIVENIYLQKKLSSDTTKATLNYIAQLKKEGVFIKKDWHHKKRINLYNQAIKFLQYERTKWKTQDDYLIRYDCLNNIVTVFQKKQKNVQKIVAINVPSTIDFDSITVYYDAKKPLGASRYTIQYRRSHQTDEKENNENSESSDIVGEPSDE